MERADVLMSGHELLDSGGVFLLVVAEGLLRGCLLTLLSGDGLGISRTLGGRIRHHLFVLLLCELLLGLSLGHLCVEILDAAIDHGNHTGAFLRLLGESLWCLRGRRGRLETPVIDTCMNMAG